MKRALLILCVFLFAVIVSAGAEALPGANGWAIDSEYGFSVCFLPTGNEQKGNPAETAESFGFSPDCDADIKNINLKSFTEMGFPVPLVADAEKKNFYIKLFRFPSRLKHLKLVSGISQDFGFNLLPGGSGISTFMADRKNIVLKKALIDLSSREFTPEKPFPGFQVFTGDDSEHANLNDSTLFYSLYFKPAADQKEKFSQLSSAEGSMAGVLAFHAELLKAYEKNFKAVVGPDASYSYFLKNLEAKSFTLLKVQKKPMLFVENWKDLPMPQNPAKKFLSSLLLIAKEDYVADEPRSEPDNIGNESFARDWKLKRKLIFEVASIFAAGKN